MVDTSFSYRTTRPPARGTDPALASTATTVSLSRTSGPCPPAPPNVGRAAPAHAPLHGPERETGRFRLEGVGREPALGKAARPPLVPREGPWQEGVDKGDDPGLAQVQQVTRAVEGEALLGVRSRQAADLPFPLDHEGRRAQVIRGRQTRQAGPQDDDGIRLGAHASPLTRSRAHRLTATSRCAAGTARRGATTGRSPRAGRTRRVRDRKSVV